MGGGLLIALEQAEQYALRTIPLEKSNVANCLRARASLNATDNSIVQYGKESDANEPDARWQLPDYQEPILQE